MKISAGQGPLNITVALPCEARPLVDYFALKRTGHGSGMVRYSGENSITVLVTGVGKSAMAASCGYLAGLQSERSSAQAAWLNIGIAGHQQFTLGDALMVCKITEQISNKTFYPPLILKTRISATEIICVDSPETAYAENAAYDMESSAFFATANRFVTAELVQLIKIVSDNPEADIGQITEAKIQGWIENKIEAIGSIVSQLQQHSAQFNELYSVNEECSELLTKVHLTITQKSQLITLYRRYYALGGEGLLEKLAQLNYQTAKQLKRAIESLIEAV